jgi:hypothetical protein
MTNEQLGVYLGQLHARLVGEIDKLDDRLGDGVSRHTVYTRKKSTPFLATPWQHPEHFDSSDTGHAIALDKMRELANSIQADIDALLNVVEMDLSSLKTTHFEQ